MKKTASFISNFSKKTILAPMFFVVIFAGILSAHNARVFADTTNLLPNPTFTADPANSTVPANWKFSTFGNNTAVSGYPAVGPDSSTIGLKTSISSYTDGFADWFTDPISVTEGAMYHYSDMYLSDSEGVIEAQYTITDPQTGATSIAFVDLQTIQSTNGSWVTSHVDFVAPAHATQLVVFHLIRSVGSLTITNPSLTKIADPVAHDSSNLLPNPTFSPDPLFPQSPLGWNYSTYGTSASETSYPAPGPDANTKALKTIVTSFTNGFVDWFPADAVSITPYGTYHYSEKYSSDVEGVIEAQFIVTDPITGAATTTYSDLSFTSPTNGWTEASFDFVVPTNATSMRVFHLIRSVGSISIASPKLSKVADPEFFPYGMVTLTFDDGNQSNYDKVFPVLKAAGLKGSFYIITGSMEEAENIGTSTGDINNDYMTAGEIWDLNAAGNEIGAHTVNHCNLATGICPDAEVANSPDPLTAQQEVSTSKTVLKDIGFKPVDTLAYPYGAYNQNIKNIVSGEGFIGARTVERGFNLPNSDRYGLRIQYINASTTSAADFNTIVKPWIDQAMKDHVWLILLMHQVETPDQVAITHDPDATSPEMLNSIVEYLKTNNIPVVTMHEGVCMMDGMQNDPRCQSATVPTGNYNHHGHDWHDYNYNWFDDEGYICDITDNNPGWLGTYYNYASTTVGMELPNDQWATAYGDPLGDKAHFTAPWFNDEFGRFVRVDKTLTFGNNFFPFDSYPEETTQGHEYHFGVRWSAEIVATTTGNYAYTLTSDDDAWVYVDGELVVDNSGLHQAKTVTGTIPLTAGSQIVEIYFTERHTTESHFSFEFADKNLNILAYSPIDCGCGEETGNTAPVITLLGSNPTIITVGTPYMDAGATAYDKEDGDITDKIVTTSNVNSNVVGTYTVTYNVKDKEGLAATPVTRTVKVVDNTGGGGGTPTGHITFCKVFANNQNVVATSSMGLPSGVFSIDLASSTSFGSSTLQTISWNAATFVANRKFILNSNDAQCVTVSNLPYGHYYYSQEKGITGQWNTPKYNDQYNQPVNNVFDFYPYSGELFTATTTDDSLRNLNADGEIVLDSFNHDRTLVILNTFNPGTTTCTTCGGGTQGANLGVTKSVDKTNANVGETITYVITVHNAGPADATGVTLTESLPAQFTLVSTSTTSGTYSTTTNVWTIGNLPNGSTTSLTLVGTVKSGTEGQKMTNSVTVTGTQTDNDTSDNTKTVDTNINGGPCTSCGGGGGTPTANLAVTKTVDKSTANVGDSITYTIKVTNSGPAHATGVSLTETFPSLLDLVSATTTSGTYSTTTNIWTIGDLPYASTTTLTIVGTIKSAAAGQKITNSVTVSGSPSDSDNSNNTSTVDTNVNGGGGGGGGGGCTTNCGGGGGGGNGPIVGSYGGSNGPIVAGTSTCYYLHDYLKKGWNNNPSEVLKLQVFLRDLEGYTDVPVNGIYDDATIKYLNMFQWKYKEDILTPWGHTAPTSFTYILTKKKVNEIYCKMVFPVTPEQQLEIDTFRNFLLHLQQNGIPSPTEYYGNPRDYNNSLGTSTEVGVATSTSTSGQSTLAGVSSTTAGIASKLTANVLSAGKKLGRLLAAIFTWPFGALWSKLSHGATACVTGVGAFGLLNIILLIIIAVISYFWYREYRNNKKIDDINKEIDLNK